MTHRLRTLAWGGLFAVTLLAVLFYSVFPTSTWLDQRASLAEVRAELDGVEAANAALAAEVALLETDAEVERIARAEHNLVRPGEEAYAVLPPEPAPVSVPDRWPFSALLDDLAG